MYKLIIRKFLFLFPPEFVHDLVIFLLKFPLISKLIRLFYYYHHPSLQRNFLNLTFSNPIGIAAGFDKDAEIVSQCQDLGFGFVEIGTITPSPQEGNPKPRIFRLRKDEALVNRMGFNNQGVDVVRQHIVDRKSKILVGGNIGKNKITPNDEAVKDYEMCFNSLYDYVDFFIVNVSSPNTPHLRELQNKEPLIKILSHLKRLSQSKSIEKPILLKIAPDLNYQQLADIVEIVKNTEISGIVATNTTISRENLNTPVEEIQKIGDGGLSGKPLRNRSTEFIRYFKEQFGDQFVIIGVGGIHSVEDALEKFEAGASLIELYTGFIYEGPALVKKIKKRLIE